MVTTITTIGRKVGAVECKNLFRHAERGRPRQDAASTATIFSLTATTEAGLRRQANKELIKVPTENEMCDAVVLGFYQQAGLAQCGDGGLSHREVVFAQFQKAGMGHFICLCRPRNLRFLCGC